MTGPSGSAPPPRPRLRALVTTGLALVLAAMFGLHPAGAQTDRTDEEGPPAGATQPQVEDLTPWTTADGDYAVRIRLPAGYPAGRLEARVFRAMESGAEVRELEDPSRRYRWGTYELEFPEGASTVTLPIPFGDSDDGSYRLALDPGVHPVLIEIFPDEGESWSTVTYLTRLPEVVVPQPVALVVPVEAPLHWSPGTGVTVSPEDVARIRALATTLAAYPEVPVTLAIEPALVAALAKDPAGVAVRDILAGVARRGDVLNAPYADIDAGAWAGTGLEADLVDQFASGEATLTAFLGRPPNKATWVVDSGDSPALLSWLSARGVDRFLLSPHVPGGGPEGNTAPLHLQGLATPHRAYAVAATDADLPAAKGNPVLQANHLLAALGVEALAGVVEPRVILAPRPVGGDLTTLTALLRALGEPGLFEPVPAASLPNTAPLSSEMPQPVAPPVDLTPLAVDMGQLHLRIASYVATVGTEDPTVAELRQPLLLAGRAGIDAAERARYLSDVDAIMRTGLSGVELADSGALTVTSHRARLPVTLHNTSSRSLEVAVTAESSELAMLGAPVKATLPPGATEDIEIPFRVSRSGDFAVQITVTSPDGAFVLTSQEVTLRSTAVSGVGIILSVGALAFLGLWWGRNFRRRRVRIPTRSVTDSSVHAPDSRVREPVP